MHSWPIMVESMSATNSRLRRVASGCTTTSIGASGERCAHALGDRFVVRAVRRKGNVGRDAGDRASAAPAPPAAAPRAQRERRLVERGPRRIGDESRDVSHRGTPDRKGGAYRRADRERQVGAGARAGASEIGGTIINADSMQVYRDLRVITARPTPEEEAQRAASALRPCGCGGELFGRALARGCRARCWTRFARPGACRSWSAAPGSTSRR